jgi:hypothetical protein
MGGHRLGYRPGFSTHITGRRGSPLNRMLAVSAVLAAAITGTGGTAQASGRVPCDPAALQSAMAGAAAGGRVALAPECTYVLTSGLPAVTGTLTITGNAATLERSSAPGTPDFTILPVTGGNLTITHLSFTNGNAGSANGGAISVTRKGQLTVTGGTFAGNSAQDGGAIFSDADPDATVISGAKFTVNTAAGGGGALYDESQANGLIVSGCQFTGNTAGGGGAIVAAGLGLGLTNSELRDNSSATGGGAITLNTALESNIQGDVIQGNSAAGGDGGGIYVAGNAGGGGGGGAFLNGTTVTGNTASGNGGGFWAGPEVQSGGRNAVISGNHAAAGGGIWAQDASFTGKGLVITGNHASGNGGGAATTGPDGFFSLTGGQVTGNTAQGRGGGIWAQGEADLTGTPVSGNNSGGGGGIYADGSGAPVYLTSAPVTGNNPDNCEPAGAIAGC